MNHGVVHERSLPSYSLYLIRIIEGSTVKIQLIGRGAYPKAKQGQGLLRTFSFLDLLRPGEDILICVGVRCTPQILLSLDLSVSDAWSDCHTGRLFQRLRRIRIRL